MFPRADPFSLLPPPLSTTMSAPSQPPFTLRLPPSRSASIRRPSSQVENPPPAQPMKTPTDTLGTHGVMSPSKNFSDRAKAHPAPGLRQVRHSVTSATPAVSLLSPYQVQKVRSVLDRRVGCRHVRIERELTHCPT